MPELSPDIVTAHKTPRLSNMEALRIIAMSMILVHHFFVHGLTAGRTHDTLFYIVNSFIFSGVNIFFLISGHFTIHFSSKGLVKLILTIMFFGAVNLLILFFLGVRVTPTACTTTLFYPISGSKYWFMKVYLLLYITSPILNAGLKAIDRRLLRNLLIVIVCFSYYMQGSHFAMSYMQGFTLYCIGYYLGHYDVACRTSRTLLLMGFFLFCAISSAGSLVAKINASSMLSFFTTYRNIFILLSAICLYLYFSKLNFTNRFVNSIASASLGCYLLQDGYIGINWLYARQIDFFKTHGYSWELAGFFATIFIVIWISSFLLTKLSNRPITWLAQKAANLFDAIYLKVSTLRWIRKHSP